MTTRIGHVNGSYKSIDMRYNRSTTLIYRSNQIKQHQSPDLLPLDVSTMADEVNWKGKYEQLQLEYDEYRQESQELEGALEKEVDAITHARDTTRKELEYLKVRQEPNHIKLCYSSHPEEP